jgi:hypothetical protein
MSHVFHRNARAVPPTAVRGEGVYIVDHAGRRYLDACGGAAVSCLGHSHAKVIQAIRDQLDRLAWTHSSFFTSEPAERLADMLIADAPGELDRVYFVTGGSEAVEAGIKLARQYYVEIGQPRRRHIIARRQSYHGNTLGALAVGGNAMRRELFQPLLIEATHIAPCYEYRDRHAEESAEAYGQRVADELEAAILKLGPDSVALFIAEPVVGATLGAVPAVAGYFQRIRAICDKYGVLLMFDEIMCGMGRTGTLYACEPDGVAPDLMAIAKGLGAGYQPIAALLVAKPVFQAIAEGSGAFMHGHTYMAHPVSCAAGIAVQTAFKEEGLLDNVKVMGARLKQRLAARFGNHHHVGDIRGRGLFLGIELVRDRATKEPFDPALKIHAAVKREAMARGLMCYPMPGTIDGRRGDHVVLAPPFIIDEGHVEEIVDKLGQAVDAAVVGA